MALLRKTWGECTHLVSKIWILWIRPKQHERRFFEYPKHLETWHFCEIVCGYFTSFYHRYFFCFYGYLLFFCNFLRALLDTVFATHLPVYRQIISIHISALHLSYNLLLHKICMKFLTNACYRYKTHKKKFEWIRQFLEKEPTTQWNCSSITKCSYVKNVHAIPRDFQEKCAMLTFL